jgi:hypothetical protein
MNVAELDKKLFEEEEKYDSNSFYDSFLDLPVYVDMGTHYSEFDIIIEHGVGIVLVPKEDLPYECGGEPLVIFLKATKPAEGDCASWDDDFDDIYA